MEIKTGLPDRIKGGITLLFWLIDLLQQKKVASLPRSTVAEKKQISWLNLFIKHCYYHHVPSAGPRCVAYLKCVLSLSALFKVQNSFVIDFAMVYDRSGSHVSSLVERRKSCCVCDLALVTKNAIYFLEKCFSVSDVAALELWLLRFSYLVLIGGFIEFTFYGRSRWEVNKRHFERYLHFLEFHVNR